MSEQLDKCDKCGAPARQDDDPDGSGVKFAPGYTREDVAAIRAAAKTKQQALSDFAREDVNSTTVQRLLQLADRLEAQLPPE